VTTGGARRRRTLALLAASLLAWLPMLLPAPSPAGGQPIDCVLDPNDPSCASSSTEADPSSSVPEETSTSEDVSTTEAPPATSVEQPITTAEPDDVAEVTSTTLSVTTSSNVLVPGDGTEGAESTTTSTTQVPTTVSDGGISDGTLIAIVIGGLITVAVLVAFLTWRYWVATRPPVMPGT
jgi:hypothetical protein